MATKVKYLDSPDPEMDQLLGIDRTAPEKPKEKGLFSRISSIFSSDEPKEELTSKIPTEDVPAKKEDPFRIEKPSKAKSNPSDLSQNLEEPDSEMDQLLGIDRTKPEPPKKGLLSRVGDEFKQVGKDYSDLWKSTPKLVKYGLEKGAEGIYRSVGAVPAAIARANDSFTGGITGDYVDESGKTQHYTESPLSQSMNYLADKAREQADIVKPRYEPRLRTPLAKIVTGIAEAPSQIAKYGIVARFLGPAAFPAVDATEKYGEGGTAQEVVDSGSKGSIMAMGLKALEPLKPVAQVAGNALLGGTQAATSGGDASDVTSSAATMGILSAIGARNPKKIEYTKEMSRGVADLEKSEEAARQSDLKTKEEAANLMNAAYTQPRKINSNAQAFQNAKDKALAKQNAINEFEASLPTGQRGLIIPAEEARQQAELEAQANSGQTAPGKTLFPIVRKAMEMARYARPLNGPIETGAPVPRPDATVVPAPRGLRVRPPEIEQATGERGVFPIGGNEEAARAEMQQRLESQGKGLRMAPPEAPNYQLPEPPAPQEPIIPTQTDIANRRLAELGQEPISDRMRIVTPQEAAARPSDPRTLYRPPVVEPIEQNRPVQAPPAQEAPVQPPVAPEAPLQATPAKEFNEKTSGPKVDAKQTPYVVETPDHQMVEPTKTVDEAASVVKNSSKVLQESPKEESSRLVTPSGKPLKATIDPDHDGSPLTLKTETQQDGTVRVIDTTTKAPTNIVGQTHQEAMDRAAETFKDAEFKLKGLRKEDTNATQEGKQPEGGVGQYQGTNEQRKATETSGGNRPVGVSPVSEEKGNVQQAQERVNPETVGEKKISSEASRVEADAIEKNLIKKFKGVTEYETMNMKEQAKAATELMDTDYWRAKRIALGSEEPPPGLRKATVFEAMKYRALERGDVSTLRALGTKSSVPKILSAYGQEIKAADFRNKEAVDPVEAINEVFKARTEAIEKTGKKVSDQKKEISKTIDKELEKASPDKDAWTEFIKSIEC